jgi:hypothetical protein
VHCHVLDMPMLRLSSMSSIGAREKLSEWLVNPDWFFAFSDSPVTSQHFFTARLLCQSSFRSPPHTLSNLMTGKISLAVNGVIRAFIDYVEGMLA